MVPPPGLGFSMVEETGGAVRFEEVNALQRGMRLLAGTRPVAWLFARVLQHLDGPVMRRTSGRHSVSSALTGLPIVELTTVGGRTGERRTLPLSECPMEIVSCSLPPTAASSTIRPGITTSWPISGAASTFAVSVTRWRPMRLKVRSASGCGSWERRRTRHVTTTRSERETVAFQ
jgi:hypothetical protein